MRHWSRRDGVRRHKVLCLLRLLRVSMRVSHQLLGRRLLLRVERLHVWVLVVVVVVVHRLRLRHLLHWGVRRWRCGSEVSVGEHVDHFVCFVFV